MLGGQRYLTLNFSGYIAQYFLIKITCERDGTGTKQTLSSASTKCLTNVNAYCYIGHEDSVGMSVCNVHISATRWRFYT
jgi:hypothetical protein